MSEKNDNIDDQSSRTNNIEDEENGNEYPPNIVRLEPDIGLGSRTQQNNRKRRSSGSNSRREENSISFRHFLQEEVGHSFNPSYPDLYSCSRHDRPVIDGSVVDPDSPDLPDFVQDHLAVEHMYFNDATHPPPVNMQNLPDFASCMPRVENTEMSLRQPPDNASQIHDSRRVPRNRVPLDLPVPNFLPDNAPSQINANSSLPVDLTTQANVTNSCDARNHTDMELSATSGGGRLPDFLSDGHVLGPSNSRHRDARVEASVNGGGLEVHTDRQSLISALRHENGRLREELSVLQSVLMKKGDRIKELEDLVMALEISKLQMSADANTQTLDKMCSSQKKNVGKLGETCNKYLHSETSQQLSNSNFTDKVREMTSTSERLVRELLKIIVEMQEDICLNDVPSSSLKHKSGQDPDDSAGGSAASIV